MYEVEHDQLQHLEKARPCNRLNTVLMLFISVLWSAAWMQNEWVNEWMTEQRFTTTGEWHFYFNRLFQVERFLFIWRYLSNRDDNSSFVTVVHWKMDKQNEFLYTLILKVLTIVPLAGENGFTANVTIKQALMTM